MTTLLTVTTHPRRPRPRCRSPACSPRDGRPARRRPGRRTVGRAVRREHLGGRLGRPRPAGRARSDDRRPGADDLGGGTRAPPPGGHPGRPARRWPAWSAWPRGSSTAGSATPRWSPAWRRTRSSCWPSPAWSGCWRRLRAVQLARQLGWRPWCSRRRPRSCRSTSVASRPTSPGRPRRLPPPASPCAPTRRPTRPRDRAAAARARARSGSRWRRSARRRCSSSTACTDVFVAYPVWLDDDRAHRLPDPDGAGHRGRRRRQRVVGSPPGRPGPGARRARRGRQRPAPHGRPTGRRRRRRRGGEGRGARRPRRLHVPGPRVLPRRARLGGRATRPRP